jgi:hypothetical protein
VVVVEAEGGSVGGVVEVGVEEGGVHEVGVPDEGDVPWRRSIMRCVSVGIEEPKIADVSPF